MCFELNRVLEDYIDENTGQPVMPSISGENAFLNGVVKPIYETVRREVDRSFNGAAPHSAWRNYDDLNEYFWSKRCFERLKWPIDLGSNFFVTSGSRKKVGKTGFVEQRSFWNIVRSFDRLWVMLILFLQAGIIVAWEEKEYPWKALKSRDVQVRVLTVFFTWSGLRFLQSLLDVGTQYNLVSRETLGLGVRMILKSVVAVVWIIVFGAFYGRIWSQRNSDLRRSPRDLSWSSEADKKVVTFLEVALVFVAPEILALALFILPWIRNFLENTDWRIFRMMTWWFQSSSFIGRGLREGLVDNIKYTLFWAMVLATKFAFSYFMQIKPMVKPSKQMLKLKDVNYEWHEFFDHSNRFSVGLLWLPVVLIYLMDLQIWYAIYSSFVGAGVGLFQHLGEIRNIQQLRLRFQFFASAIQFNLMPEEQLLNAAPLASD
jgi:callose synthase